MEFRGIRWKIFHGILSGIGTWNSMKTFPWNSMEFHKSSTPWNSVWHQDFEVRMKKYPWNSIEN